MKQERIPFPNSSGQFEQPSPTPVSMADIQKYIGAIAFPCDKDDLVELVVANNAPDEVIHVVEFFPNREFDSPMEMALCLGANQR